MLASSSLPAAVRTCRPGCAARPAGRSARSGGLSASRAPVGRVCGGRGVVWVVRAGAEGEAEEREDAGASPSGGPMYMDEADTERELRSKRQVSDAMKEKLRAESLGLGGDPNNPLPSNYFANIILGISVLALVTVLFSGM